MGINKVPTREVINIPAKTAIPSEIRLEAPAPVEITSGKVPKAIEYAGLTGKERIVDAYCGIGTIGLIAASKAKEVIRIGRRRTRPPSIADSSVDLPAAR